MASRRPEIYFRLAVDFFFLAFHYLRFVQLIIVLEFTPNPTILSFHLQTLPSSLSISNPHLLFLPPPPPAARIVPRAAARLLLVVAAPRTYSAAGAAPRCRCLRRPCSTCIACVLSPAPPLPRPRPVVAPLLPAATPPSPAAADEEVDEKMLIFNI